MDFNFINILKNLPQNTVTIIAILSIAFVFLLKSINSIHTTELELLLMDDKESEKHRMQMRTLIIFLFTAEGAGLNFYSGSFFDSLLSMPICGRIIIVLACLVTAVVLILKNEKKSRLAIIMYLLILLFEMIISYNAKSNSNSGLVSYLIIPLVGAIFISFFMEVNSTPKFMKESSFSIDIKGEECYIISRIGDRLLCGNSITMEQSDRLRMVKVSDVKNGRYILKNLKHKQNGDSIKLERYEDVE